MILASMARLAGMQDPDGCFPSEVRGRGWISSDRNGFTTAMVLRALRDVQAEEDLLPLRSSALDFVERCRSALTPGAFGFWPEDMHPAWAPPLPADLDDTAIMTIELMRAGRRSREDGLRSVCLVLIPHRVSAREAGRRPSWIVPGAFKTWVGDPGRPNVVDCCVNANAAALMAVVGATQLPGYQEAISTILQGIAWAEINPVRQQAITPFYPAIHALLEAVEHAVDCGVRSLHPAIDHLQHLIGNMPAPSACCCSAYGATVWRCPALEAARALREQGEPVQQ
jgi:hypothetical protein